MIEQALKKGLLDLVKSVLVENNSDVKEIKNLKFIEFADEETLRDLYTNIWSKYFPDCSYAQFSNSSIESLFELPEEK